MALDPFPMRFPIFPKAFLVFGLLMALTLSAALAGGAQDKKKDAVIKTVHGLVVDKAENNLPAAIVYLKNMQNSSVKTSFADDGGNYRFSGLDPNTDYEIHAEFKGDVSTTRRLSSLDSRKDIYLNLVIQPKK